MNFMIVWIIALTLHMDLSKSMESFTYANFKPLTTAEPTDKQYHCESKDLNQSDIHCYGSLLLEIPSDLNRHLTKLTITDSNIKYIKRNSLDPYRITLRDVTLSNLPYLRVIEEGTFADIFNLRTLYISHAPQLKFLHGLLQGVTSWKFYSLRILWTGLHEVPDLFLLPENNTMFLLDLDHNKIERLPPNSIKITAQQVTLNFNEISYVDNFAFNGSQIAELYMRSNYKLNEIGKNAFSGLRSLRLLDLSETSIQSIPVTGLSELETLKIEDTPTMQTIPSIYDFTNLKDAKLTHSFHCCAFKYPEQHDPEKHAQYEENLKKMCKMLTQSGSSLTPVSRRRRFTNFENLVYTNYVSRSNRKDDPFLNSSENDPFKHSKFGNADNSLFTPLRGKTIERQEGKAIDVTEEDDGVFHSNPTKINESQLDAICGKLIFRKPEVNCSPEPNALNPCEDIMGSSWLRVSVWCVLILALVGNLLVIIVFLFGDSEMNVSRFLICNLAFADLCMGLYLLLIASMDYHSMGQYFNFAFNWQNGLGCQIAGFLTVFSSHLSIYTLTIVTLERWFAITYAIYLTKRITINSAKKILIGGWFYSILLATLPLLGFSNYRSTSICLPMEANKITDKIYLYGVITVNGFAFVLIVFCYVQIYLSLGYETRHSSTRGEMTIAKKMALLIFTDFATYSPIAFFGLTALAGYPLIGVTRSKILLVFFYPLNACANPYLYALMTSQYRRDLCVLIARWGVCKKKAEEYKLSEIMPMAKPAPLLNSNHGQYNSIRSRDIKVENSYV